MNFADSRRRLFIEGTDPNQIDALFSMLKEKIENRSSFLGGDGFRGLLFFVPFIFLMTYFLLGV